MSADCAKLVISSLEVIAEAYDVTATLVVVPMEMLDPESPKAVLADTASLDDAVRLGGY